MIQTGATSSTGKYVIQLAKSRDINTINVIRDRPNRHQIKELKELGATAVVTPSNDELMRSWQHSPPKLALDCISGDATAAVVKALAPGGTLVVYGAVSKEPLANARGHLIFRDIRIRGFWLTGNYAKMKDGWKAEEQLVDRVCALFRQKVLKPVEVDCIPLSQWESAMEGYRKNHRDAKVILTNYRG